MGGKTTNQLISYYHLLCVAIGNQSSANSGPSATGFGQGPACEKPQEKPSSINVLGLNESDKKHIRYLLRMVPKGRTDLENYFVGTESIRLLHKIKKILTNIYGEVPVIQFTGDRAAKFTEKKPYLFQWNGGLLNKAYITAYLRFLTHGLVFTTRDGKQVSMKSHLLRHAFATHSVHVEKMPVDLIAQILHQKM